MQILSRYTRPRSGGLASHARALVCLAGLAAGLVSGLAGAASAATTVQQVTSPGGIRAWLMEDRSVPLVTVNFSFRGGGSQDAPGKDGTARFLANTIDEGAGTLDMTAFQRTIARLGIKVSFSSNDDWWSGSFATLLEHRDEAAKLMRSVLIEPRIDEGSIERSRRQFLSALAQRLKTPNGLAADRLFAISYPAHPYGRPGGGREEALRAITRDDIEAYRRRVFARDNLVVSAAGAIDATELGALLDRVFGDLPAKAQLEPVTRVVPQGAGRVEIVDIDVPQSIAVFQLPGLDVADPDYMTARVMMQILASGGFESRLMKEIRVKRGLAYGVSASLNASLASNMIVGSLSTRNDAIAQALDVLRAELARMAAEGPTADELAETKSSMIGGFALNFDTIGSMTSLMQTTQLSGLGADYFDGRTAMIERVTADDVKRVAARLLRPERLLITIAGRPQAVVATKTP